MLWLDRRGKGNTQRYARTGEPGAVPKVGSYTLLVVVTRTGSRLAVDSDVTEGSEYAFALTEQAIKAGAVTVEWQSHGYENSRLHAFLRHSIYHHQTLDDLAKLPLFGGFSAFLVCLMVAIPKDVASAQRNGLVTQSARWRSSGSAKAVQPGAIRRDETPRAITLNVRSNRW